MYDSVERAISDMEDMSRFGPSKIKPGKWEKKPCKEDIFMVQPMAPMQMGCGLEDMTMNMMQPMTPNMDMMQNYLGNQSCNMPCNMMSPQMVQSQVPQCMQELYLAYPYLNPNR